MAEMQPTMEILERIKKNSKENKDEVFTRLYRYMLRPDLYYIAYKNLYANNGAASGYADALCTPPPRRRFRRNDGSHR